MADVEGMRAEAVRDFAVASVQAAMGHCMGEPYMRDAVSMRYLGAPTTRQAIAVALGTTVGMVDKREARAVRALARWLAADRAAGGAWNATACALAWHAEIATARHVAMTGDASLGRLYGTDPLAAMAVDALALAGFPARVADGRVTCHAEGWTASKAEVARQAGTWSTTFAAADLRPLTG